jgi:hypothetical protein
MSTITSEDKEKNLVRSRCEYLKQRTFPTHPFSIERSALNEEDVPEEIFPIRLFSEGNGDSFAVLN